MSHKLQSYELYLGALYGVLQFFVLPYLAVLINYYVQLPVWALNFSLFLLNFLCLCAICHRYLWENLKTAVSAPWRTLRYAGQGIVLYYSLSALVGMLILHFAPQFTNLNDESVSAMQTQGGFAMSFATVFLVPVAEETLFRGLLFRGLYDRSPVLSWLISTVVFSLVHIAGYIGQYDPMMLLMAFRQYLPAGICLAYAHKKADTILSPILMHIAINQVALNLL